MLFQILYLQEHLTLGAAVRDLLSQQGSPVRAEAFVSPRGHLVVQPAGRSVLRREGSVLGHFSLTNSHGVGAAGGEGTTRRGVEWVGRGAVYRDKLSRAVCCRDRIQ